MYKPQNITYVYKGKKITFLCKHSQPWYIGEASEAMAIISMQSFSEF